MKKLYFSLGLAAFLTLFVIQVNANDCATANLITSQEDLADSQLSGSFVGAGFSGDAQCVGPGGSDDVWYRFIAVATRHGVQAVGVGDLDLAIEVYDACAGTQLLCENSTGAGGSELALVSGLTPGNTYLYRVYHADAVPATSTDFTTAVAHIPFVELVSSDCGVTDYTTNDVIRATPPSNTTNFTNYQFRFQELEAPFNTYTITSPNGTNPNFLLEWFPQIEYGRTYDVSVRVRAIIPSYGDFGNTCTIGLQNDVLTTNLESQYANGFFDFCDIIGATKVALATQYRWNFINLDDLSSTEVIGLSDSRLLNLYRVPNLELGATYAVGIFATVAGQESSAGTLSFLNMNNAVPNTGLNSDIYPCGQTYPISTFLQAREVCEAESYTWRFSNTTQAQEQLFYTRNDGSRFVDLDFVTGLNVGDSYDVEVLAAQGGLVGDYSSICNITIGDSQSPGLLLTLSDDDPVSSDVDLSDSQVNPLFWEVDVVPANNGSQAYNLQLSSEDPSTTVRVEIFDLNGRRLPTNGSILTSGETLRLDFNSFTQGIYILRIYNDQGQITKRVSVLR